MYFSGISGFSSALPVSPSPHSTCPCSVCDGIFFLFYTNVTQTRWSQDRSVFFSTVCTTQITACFEQTHTYTQTKTSFSSVFVLFTSAALHWKTNTVHVVLVKGLNTCWKAPIIKAGSTVFTCPSEPVTHVYEEETDTRRLEDGVREGRQYSKCTECGYS